MKKSLMTQVGITDDLRPVMGGIFKMQDTYGLPLLLMWKQLADHGAVIAWDVYAKDALAHGWTSDKILSGIREVARFGYDRAEGDLLMFGITKFMEALHEKVSDGEASLNPADRNGVGAVPERSHTGGRDSADGRLLQQGHDSEPIPQSR